MENGLVMVAYAIMNKQKKRIDIQSVVGIIMEKKNALIKKRMMSNFFFKIIVQFADRLTIQYES